MIVSKNSKAKGHILLDAQTNIDLVNRFKSRRGEDGSVDVIYDQPEAPSQAVANGYNQMAQLVAPAMTQRTGLGNSDILSEIASGARYDNGIDYNSEIAKVNAMINGIGAVPSSGSSAPVNGKMSVAIDNIRKQNLKYSQGREKGCTDCSAFTQKVFLDTYGKNIGGNTETQWKTGKKIDLSSAKPGDLLFFKSPKKKYKNRNVTHVGINNGDGTMTHFGVNGLSTVPLKGYSLPLIGARSYD